MKTLHLLAVLTAVLLCCLPSSAPARTPGTVDPSFGIGDDSTLNGFVLAIALAADGGSYIGGDFTMTRGISRNRIARLHADGRVDTNFNVGSGADGTVNAVAVQPDGKVLIGGSFTSVNGIPRRGVARLHSDGRVDLTFLPGSGANDAVLALSVLPDGNLLIGGRFTTVNGLQSNGVARLDAQGRFDSTYRYAAADGTRVISFAPQSDGKVIIGGSFATVGGQLRRGVARLEADGSLDREFNPGSGANLEVRAVAVDQDGNVLIAGRFTALNNIWRNSIARLRNDGSLDSTFDPGTGPSGMLHTLIPQADGKVIIGGQFSTVNGISRSFVARLHGNGTLDSSFGPGTPPSRSVFAMAQQADGKLLIGGSFAAVGETPRARIARLNRDGTLDFTFNRTVGTNQSVTSMTLQPDGKVLISGQFIYVNDMAINRIARLHTDGTLDRGFDPGSGLNWPAIAMALQPDGKVLIGGGFTSVNATAMNRISRLMSDGTLDRAFDPGSGADATVRSIALQPDGKVLIGGSFTTVNGTTIGRIARLHSDGSLDASFIPRVDISEGVLTSVSSLALQPDGRVLIVSDFTQEDGMIIAGVARLETDGALDHSFGFARVAGGRTLATIYSMVLQADGRVVIAGQFSNVKDVTRHGIARLNGDGSVDNTFTAGLYPDAPVDRVALHADGRLVIAGRFLSVASEPRSGLARLHNDGSLDREFIPPVGLGQSVSAIALEADGDVLIGGGFAPLTGAAGSRIARLLGGGVLSPAQQFASVSSESGSLGSDIAAESTPHGDGVDNLLKYAFNMNLADKDSRTIPPGGTAGLPTITTQPNTPAGILRFEFVRRIGSGLIYTPQKSPNPGNPASWVPLTDTPSVNAIDAAWERVIYEEPYDPAAAPRLFGRVQLRLP